MARFEKRGFIKGPSQSGEEGKAADQPELPDIEQTAVEEEKRNQWLFPEEAVVRAEEAAEFLVQFLPRETRELIEEARKLRAVPLWQMLLGYVMRYAERYELFSPVILSAWESGGRADVPRPCKSCGEPFSSRFPGAAHCCNPCACGKLRELGHAEDCPVVELQRVGTRG